MRALLSSDSDQVVWWGTRPECISALARKGREQAINPMGEAQARVLLFQLSKSWNRFSRATGSGLWRKVFWMLTP